MANEKPNELTTGAQIFLLIAGAGFLWFFVYPSLRTKQNTPAPTRPHGYGPYHDLAKRFAAEQPGTAPVQPRPGPSEAERRAAAKYDEGVRARSQGNYGQAIACFTEA